jgi:tetratricopeptide (TPR) repeat protein
MPALAAELSAIQQAWAQASYRTPDAAARKQAFATLATRAAALSKAYPGQAEPLVWEGIVLSTYAGAKGGLGALGLAKQAREKLQAAIKIDPGTLEGSAYTSLGTLYHKVPGFPLGFGDDARAKDLLQHALQLNPAGIDPNYFYGELLFDKGDYAQAVRHLEKALAAPPRPNRQLADEGRRREITARQKMS